LGPGHPVVEGPDPIRGAEQPFGPGPAGGGQNFPFFRGKPAAGSGIGRAGIADLGRAGQGPEFPAGAETGIGEVLGREMGQGRPVGRAAAALGRGFLVPIQAQPGQVLADLLGLAGPAAGRVQVFQAQNQPPPGPARLQPGQPEGPGIAQVQAAGGAGGQAAYD
jgi:hypothetical protein